MKILIIEDEKLLADSVKMLLERKGFAVEWNDAMFAPSCHAGHIMCEAHIIAEGSIICPTGQTSFKDPLNCTFRQLKPHKSTPAGTLLSLFVGSTNWDFSNLVTLL